jgi:hypothetical protein
MATLDDISPIFPGESWSVREVAAESAGPWLCLRLRGGSEATRIGCGSDVDGMEKTWLIDD